jgi:hypothetical protein
MWFSNDANVAQRRSETTPARIASLEVPTLLFARGISPVKAVVEHITAAGCSLRTVVLLDRGSSVEFDFAIPDQPTVHVRGRVAMRVGKGPRFVYHLALDAMRPAESDALAYVTAKLHTRQARARRMERVIGKLPTTDGLVRAAVRVASEFPISYRTAKEPHRSAKAGDVSTGGLSMTCSHALLDAEMVELRFTLPSDVLDVHPEQTAILDITTRAVRRERADLRRPFEEMTVYARIVSHRAIAGGHYGYGVKFVNLDRSTRDELARYVHAVDLAQR